MATFKESYRLERVYFEKLKSMIDILKSFLDSETDEKTRAILTNEIDDNGAILLLYRNLGEAWSELADLIQKLRNDMNDLDEKEEAYHDELNERIDEVNNYLMALIRDLQARMDAVEADLAQMGRLFTYDLTQSGAVYTLTESGNAVTFADTVAKLTHTRPHFVAVRNGANYYLIDTYDLTTATGSVTWSGWKFTAAGEIVQTVVTLNADNSVSVTETATNFAAILSRLTSVETRVSTLEECCEDVGEALEYIGNALDELGEEVETAKGFDLYLYYIGDGRYSIKDKKGNIVFCTQAIVNAILNLGLKVRLIIEDVNCQESPDLPDHYLSDGDRILSNVSECWWNDKKELVFHDIYADFNYQNQVKLIQVDVILTEDNVYVVVDSILLDEAENN